ncbi:MAG: GNAT family N-acetyltransferase, partial [Lachnospiraceae bacterium]|nr:GNAT family N-acetyltransferase [Lachnospiraceae bacterium]
ISRRDFAISNENDDYLGQVSLKNIDDDEGSAEISVVLKGGFHGKGIAAEAVTQLMRIGFYGLHLNVLYSYTKIENKKAVRLFENLGFEKKEAGEGSFLFVKVFNC